MFLGLDLGQYNERSAMAVVSVNIVEKQRQYVCRHLKVWPRGTETNVIQDDVTSIVTEIKAKGHRIVATVINTTSVGDAVWQAFRRRLKNTKLIDVRLQGLGARTVLEKTKASVSRLDLASSLTVLFNDQRLIIAPSLEHANALRKEIVDYSLRPPAQTESDALGRATPNDDLVMAVTLACWAGEQSIYNSSFQIAFVSPSSNSRIRRPP